MLIPLSLEPCGQRLVSVAIPTMRVFLVGADEILVAMLIGGAQRTTYGVAVMDTDSHVPAKCRAVRLIGVTASVSAPHHARAWAFEQVVEHFRCGVHELHLAVAMQRNQVTQCMVRQHGEMRT